MRTQYKKSDPTTLLAFLSGDDKQLLRDNFPVASRNPLRKEGRQLVITPYEGTPNIQIPTGQFRAYAPSEDSPIYLLVSRFNAKNFFYELEGEEISIQDKNITLSRIVLRDEIRPQRKKSTIAREIKEDIPLAQMVMRGGDCS